MRRWRCCSQFWPIIDSKCSIQWPTWPNRAMRSSRGAALREPWEIADPCFDVSGLSAAIAVALMSEVLPSKTIFKVDEQPLQLDSFLSPAKTSNLQELISLEQRWVWLLPFNRPLTTRTQAMETALECLLTMAGTFPRTPVQRSSFRSVSRHLHTSLVYRPRALAT